MTTRLVVTGLLAAGAVCVAIFVGAALAQGSFRPLLQDTWPPWMQAFGGLVATFSGVFAAFWLNRWWESRVSRRDYAAVLAACQFDLASAQASVGAIEQQISETAVVVLDIEAPALIALVASPRLYQHSGTGFVLTLRSLAALIKTSGNMMAHYRHAVVGGGSLSKTNLEDVRWRMRKLRQAIVVVQQGIYEEMARLRYVLLLSAEDQKTIEAFKQTLAGQDQDGMAAPDTKPGENKI